MLEGCIMMLKYVRVHFNLQMREASEARSGLTRMRRVKVCVFLY